MLALQVCPLAQSPASAQPVRKLFVLLASCVDWLQLQSICSQGGISYITRCILVFWTFIRVYNAKYLFKQICSPSGRSHDSVTLLSLQVCLLISTTRQCASWWRVEDAASQRFGACRWCTRAYTMQQRQRMRRRWLELSQWSGLHQIRCDIEFAHAHLLSGCCTCNGKPGANGVATAKRLCLGGFVTGIEYFIQSSVPWRSQL